MASNPYVNKVQFGNTTVMDISDSTATEGDVVSGKTFYKASGAKATGSAVIPDISNCYQTTDDEYNTIMDDDYYPFYSDVYSAQKKTKWSNIKAKLKTFFDSIYSSFVGTEVELKDTVGWVCKNLVPLTLDSIKALNTTGTWSGNVYTQNGVTITVNTNADGYVTSIATSGTCSSAFTFFFLNGTNGGYASILPAGDYIANGCPDGGGWLTNYHIGFSQNTDRAVIADSADYNIEVGSTSSTTMSWYIYMTSGTNMSSKTFYPMIRKNTIGSNVYAPYHPTVEEELADAGHEMIPVANDIATVAALANGNNNYVINAYTAKRYSNTEVITLIATIPQNTDTIGTWADNWETSGVRTGWLWHSALAGILSDNEVSFEVEFDPYAREVVSVYAYRIDDAVVHNGVTGGAIAIKLNNAVQSLSGVKIAVKLTRQRTEVYNFTTLT